jgi:hypothetical protein
MKPSSSGQDRLQPDPTHLSHSIIIIVRQQERICIGGPAAVSYQDREYACYGDAQRLGGR